jgi:hypothetical protein
MMTKDIIDWLILGSVLALIVTFLFVSETIDKSALPEERE